MWWSKTSVRFFLVSKFLQKKNRLRFFSKRAKFFFATVFLFVVGVLRFKILRREANETTCRKVCSHLARLHVGNSPWLHISFTKWQNKITGFSLKYRISCGGGMETSLFVSYRTDGHGLLWKLFRNNWESKVSTPLKIHSSTLNSYTIDPKGSRIGPSLAIIFSRAFAVQLQGVTNVGCSHYRYRHLFSKPLTAFWLPNYVTVVVAGLPGCLRIVFVFQFKGDFTFLLRCEMIPTALKKSILFRIFLFELDAGCGIFCHVWSYFSTQYGCHFVGAFTHCDPHLRSVKKTSTLHRFSFQMRPPNETKKRSMRKE